jgi:short-subunit dehydrogenase
MKEFKDKLAIITGGASGIGREIAQKCLKEEMHIVLIDIDQEALNVFREDHISYDDRIQDIVADVSKPEEVEKCSRIILKKFDRIDLLFNNAGVLISNQIWKHSLKDYQWIFGVNLWSVIYFLHYFLPILISQDSESHIINTASISGFLPGQGLYGITKHAVVSLSESLYFELKLAKINHVNVSILCPPFVKTNLAKSEKHRPNRLKNAQMSLNGNSHTYEKRMKTFEKCIQAGIPCSQVVDYAFQGINENKFYIITEENPWWINILRKRIDYVEKGINPDDLPMSM